MEVDRFGIFRAGLFLERRRERSQGDGGQQE